MIAPTRASGAASGLLIALCLLLGAAVHLQAQEEQQTDPAKQLQPVSGQPGKDVPWIPTPQTLVDKMLDMAKVTPQDYLVDLGSGDGRAVITAAKRGTPSLGIEYEPKLVELSKLAAAKEGVSNKATFVKADLFESDFSRATVVILFLESDINLRLRPKLLDMRPGTRIVSNTFDMGDWKPDETATVTDGCSSIWCTALLWIVPAKAAGNWQFGGGQWELHGGEWELHGGELALTQQFQILSGALALNGKNTAISDGKMFADQITFRAGNTVYNGRLTGNAIEGTATVNGISVPWSATRVGK